MKYSSFKKNVIYFIIGLLFLVCILPSIGCNLNKSYEDINSENVIKNQPVNLPMDAQSTTGPIPPDDRDLGFDPNLIIGQTVISGVPTYKWRHGCGPTAAGMVIGYWDGHGYDDLIPGDASTQTFAVKQAIASGGNLSNPNPPGSEKHYEDYSRPQDNYPNMIPDDYITKGRTPHIDNCLADYMDTSKSTRSNYYGWSWFDDVDDALTDYVNLVIPTHKAIAYNQIWGEFTWEDYCREIDHNRPVVLLVDYDGNGGTDHFITALGYDDNQNYACHDTWDNNLHWYDFSKIESGNPWGIYGATFFAINTGKFNIGLIWGKYDSMKKIGNETIIDCNLSDLYILGIGKTTDGCLMFFKSDFTKITPKIFFGIPIGGRLFGIVLNCEIY